AERGRRAQAPLERSVCERAFRWWRTSTAQHQPANLRTIHTLHTLASVCLQRRNTHTQRESRTCAHTNTHIYIYRYRDTHTHNRHCLSVCPQLGHSTYTHKHTHTHTHTFYITHTRQHTSLE